MSEKQNESLAFADLPKVRRTYKDSVFRILFKEKEALLHLYNALNGTDYDNPDDLEINTLENAVYIGMKNDVSFVFNFQMYLLEHQSTVNPNMPLRNLLYVSDSYAGMVGMKKMYSSTLVQIPAPHFVIFYNGVKEQPEKVEMKLSQAFARRSQDPALELKVILYNVNPGYNEELVRDCEELRGYQVFVEKIRRYRKVLPLDEAVDRSIRECMEEDVLKAFLTRNRAEVRHMSIYEFNQEEYEEVIREDAYECAEEKGIKILLSICRDLGASREYVLNRLRQEYSLSLEKAEKYMEAYEG